MICDLNSLRVLVVYISFVGSLQEFLFVVLATIFTLYIFSVLELTWCCRQTHIRFRFRRDMATVWYLEVSCSNAQGSAAVKCALHWQLSVQWCGKASVQSNSHISRISYIITAVVTWRWWTRFTQYYFCNVMKRVTRSFKCWRKGPVHTNTASLKPQFFVPAFAWTEP